MSHSDSDLYGLDVEASDGAIGRVVDLYFEDDTWTIRFLLVATGAWLAGRRVLIPPSVIGTPDWTARCLSASVTLAQVSKSPPTDTCKPVSRQHEVEQYGYYGMPYDWGGAGLWGEGMMPAMMQAPGGRGHLDTPEQQAFVQAQAEFHRQRGDDPHLRSSHAILRYHIHATDGEVGHVEGLLLEDGAWAIRGLILNTSDWWLGHRVVIATASIVDIRWLEATVAVGLTRQAIRDSPRAP